MNLPPPYRWLNNVGTLPRLVQEGLKLLGTVEAPGKADNPTILAWAKETGLRNVYTADSIPWCGLWMAVVHQRAGKPPVSGPLWALNWAKAGGEAGQPMLGDILTFVRNGGGHVGIYLGEDKTAYHVLGGNQSDAVTICRIDKKRLYRARRPRMKLPPASRKPYILDAVGVVSVNEA